MQDFVRIGGEIVSAPLNENFRRLLNQISISNTNLIFPDQNAVVDTITDMQAIVEPDDAQSCYVVSSGELYRYTKNGEKWVKIADFGQTFRQGFLNSGAVVLEDYVKLKDGTKTTLAMPSMLVYFKNKPGDERYLKGMYLIEAVELDVSTMISGANAYSIMVDYTGKYSLVSGLPTTDDPNHIFIGTILVNNDGEILSDFIYTLPDIAYTADRGNFLMNGGQASGCNLDPSSGRKVSRRFGYYYDEGINFPLGPTENFPIDTDNGSNFDLKAYEGEAPVSKIYYMVPDNPLKHEISVSDGLIINKYWDGSNLVDVSDGHYTIQQHLVTPSGQNIILYGTREYNSMMDATSNLNTISTLNIAFPYIEATRIIVGNIGETFSTDISNHCQFFTLGHLSQVGTVSPEFADNVFKIYSGIAGDNTPASMRFDLKELEFEEFDNIYTLGIRRYTDKDYIFGLDGKYITDDYIYPVQATADILNFSNGAPGYEIPTQYGVDRLRQRIEDIEKELWSPKKDEVNRYDQSVRYRLFHNEATLDKHTTDLTEHAGRLTYLEQNKVSKATKINGQKLGDTTDVGEVKDIVLYTGDIAEGLGTGSIINEWFTQEKVSKNTDVKAAKAHADIISLNDNAGSHTKVNPHGLSTDDINILMDTTKIFVTPDEERRIRADRLPDDTIKALADLDAKNLDSVAISYMEGNSNQPGLGPYQVGNITGIRFFQDGVNMSMDADGETLILECTGQMDENKVMFKSRYASLEAEYPDLYGGYVDNAVNAIYADNVHGVEEATANQYYGTNDKTEVGLFDLPVYVSTADAESFASIDQVVFEPVDESVQEKHLAPSLLEKINNNYHAVWNNGVLLSAEINTFSFGDNLSVKISGNTATVSASGEGGSGGVSNFINLNDVDVTYTGNEGKSIIINEEGTGLTVTDTPAMSSYMLKAVYTDEDEPTKVKRAVLADTATLAISANNSLKVNDKSVDDTKTSNAYLWTAEKIISNTTSQIKNEGVNTYSGTTVPDNSLGKNGDLYILIEG